MTSKTYNFKLVTENNRNLDLLLEIKKLEYVDGSDLIAFNAVKQSAQSDIFGMAGLYFQEHLLPSLAGFSEQNLNYACGKTRQSLLALVDMILRLSESAGRANIEYEYSEGSNTKIVQLEPLSSLALSLYNLLDNLRTTEHQSIGVRIGALFAKEGVKPETMCLYLGTVQKFLPDTKPNKGDHLYHILFDDNDEEDYDEDQYQTGIDYHLTFVR